MAIVS